MGLVAFIASFFWAKLITSLGFVKQCLSYATAMLLPVDLATTVFCKRLSKSES